MTKTRTSIFIIIILIISFFYWIINKEIIQDKFQNKEITHLKKKLIISTSFFPLYDFAKTIVGDKAIVKIVVQGGAHVHDYELTAGEIIGVNHSDVFIVMGNKFEKFEEQLLANLNPKIKVIYAATNIPINNQGNKHAWTSFRYMQMMVRNIVEKLIIIDPQNQDTYKNNRLDFLEGLKNIDKQYTQELSHCKKNHILIINHNSFINLSQDYHFKVVTLHGLSEHGGVSADEIISFVKGARKHDVKYLFSEGLIDTNSRLLQSIVKEINLPILILNSLETANQTSDSTLSLLRKNLVNFKIGLEC